MKILPTILVSLALAVSGVGAAVSAQTPTTSQPAHCEWNIDIDQPIQQLEEILQATEQQQPANFTISNLAFLYDAKLYILFNRYLDTLPPAKRAEACSEQQQWLKRQKKAIDDGYAKYAGGTMAAYSAGEASIEITKTRIAEIEARLKKPKK